MKITGITSQQQLSYSDQQELPDQYQMYAYILTTIILTVQANAMSYVFSPAWQGEGVGAKVLRVIGNQYLDRLDPFLMLDYFKVRLPAGFPDHPHRGFETVTYMKQGRIFHEDFKGHKGVIGPGDIQWMTAGKGIVHAEMPASKDEDSIGLQLWLNLRANEKMIEPRYQELTSDQIPVFQKDGARVKIICGNWEGHVGPVKYNTPSYYMDIQLGKQSQFKIPIEQGWNSIIFVYEGDVAYSAEKAAHKVGHLNCCVLEKSEEKEIEHSVRTEKGAKFVLIAGKPLKEPIASHGPFVMNTNEQIRKTFMDYQGATNGFEGSDKWKSKIRQLSKGKSVEEL